MSRRRDIEWMWRSTARGAVGLLLVFSLWVLPVPGPAPAGALGEDPGRDGGGVLSCSHADSVDGVQVSWNSLAIDADTIVVERSIDGGQTYERRGWGWVDDEVWLDRELGDLVPDQPVTEALDPDDTAEDRLEQAKTSGQYRIVVVDGDERVASLPCSWVRGNTGRFECSVAIEDDGYRVEWIGGPTGAGLDYVVERFVDRGDESQFHWRARRFDRSFLDGGADRLPIYRVTARFDRADAVSVECGVDGVMATRAPDAAFVCPVPGSSFVDTFGADRDGGARRHMGVDMFAPTGTPVLAPESGQLVQFWNRLGGRSFGLYGDSGTFYYGAHLDQYAGSDRRVVAGEAVGTVGNTGNARTTPPHLHFQIHPDGRRTPAVNPTAATGAACR